jgi:hypothetical protein
MNQITADATLRLAAPKRAKTGAAGGFCRGRGGNVIFLPQKRWPHIAAPPSATIFSEYIRFANEPTPAENQ